MSAYCVSTENLGTKEKHTLLIYRSNRTRLSLLRSEFDGLTREQRTETGIVMSETPQISVATRIVPGLTIIALIVMIAAAIFHVATLSPVPEQSFSRGDAPPAPDYTQPTAWLSLPDPAPEGGWEKPWGVDLIWFVDQPEGYFGGWNIPLDWAPTNEQLNQQSWLNENDLISVPLYAPRRRHLSSASGEEADQKSASRLEQEDVLDATDFYLEERNLQRGIFLGGSGTGVMQAVAVVDMRLAETKPYDQLLGGIVVAPNGTDAQLPPWPDCEETITDFPCILDLSTSGDTGTSIERLGRTFDKFSVWLDQNVSKPAAPLPPFETIELSPIRRPGEVVETE